MNANNGWDDRTVDVHAAEVPPAVRDAVLARMVPGDTLWRCPRMGAPKGGLGLGRREVLVEWWLIDANGGLIEVFWEK